MTERRPFFPPASRALVGIAMIVASIGLSYGQARSLEGPIEALDWMTQNRSPGDSAVYANAAYHAAYASEIFRRRWTATGYMTLGTAGVVFGLALALSALLGRATIRAASTV